MGYVNLTAVDVDWPPEEEETHSVLLGGRVDYAIDEMLRASSVPVARWISHTGSESRMLIGD